MFFNVQKHFISFKPKYYTVWFNVYSQFLFLPPNEVDIIRK